MFKSIKQVHIKFNVWSKKSLYFFSGPNTTPLNEIANYVEIKRTILSCVENAGGMA